MSENHFIRRNWRLITTVVTFIALGILIFVTRKQIVDTFENFKHINSYALLLMPVWQALNYVSYANLYQNLLAILDEKVEFRSMYRVALELNFVNNVFPSGGVSSFSYFSVRMRSFDVPGAKSTIVQFMRFIMVFISFQILLFIGLITLAIGGQASGLVLLIGGSLFTLLLVFTLLMAYIVGSKTRINNTLTWLTKAFNWFVARFRHGHPETINILRAQTVFTDLHENYIIIKDNYRDLKKPLLFALMANLTEVLTVYTVYIAFGQWVNPGAVIIAYAIANFAGLISVLPGGVGIYEGLMTATLAAAGVPAGVSIPVTIMYRVLNMSIQLPPGYYFYHKFMNTKPPEQVEAT